MTAPILVTGTAGFIGHAVAHRLLARGDAVIGVDNFNDYYDPALKNARAASFDSFASFQMKRMDISDAGALATLVSEHRITRVVHLAAQAGVRYSIENPFAYQRSNLLGHLAVLEACRHAEGFEHLVYASSSSVYGDRPLGNVGFTEDQAAERPVSLYAATKRANELMSASYSHLYALPQSGLRFFTVYGPWGRPDMALFGFTKKILAGEPISVFGEGRMTRDFTYVDDIVDGIVGTLDRPPAKAEGHHRVLNIGDSHPVALMDMIAALERSLGCDAEKILLPMQPGDVTATFADVSKLNALTGYAPKVRLEEGIGRFVTWYRDFYGS